MRRLLAATAVAVLMAAAPAVAAPARTVVLDDTEHLSGTWDFGPGTGLFGDAMVADHAPCTPGLQTCDLTLVKIDGETPGDLAVSSATSDQTLVDVDVYIYASDKDGTQGEQLAVANGFTPNETAAAPVEPGGYYLVNVAYMTGFGNYAGSAQFTPYVPDPEEDEG